MNRDSEWVARAKEIAEAHFRKLKADPTWTGQDTARVCHCSRGYVSETLAIFRAAENDPSLWKCIDRVTALGKLKKRDERFQNGTKVEVMFGTKVERGVILGRGTIIPRDPVFIVQLDEPMFFERVSRRISAIVARPEQVREYV